MVILLPATRFPIISIWSEAMFQSNSQGKAHGTKATFVSFSRISAHNVFTLTSPIWDYSRLSRAAQHIQCQCRIPLFFQMSHRLASEWFPIVKESAPSAVHVIVESYQIPTIASELCHSMYPLIEQPEPSFLHSCTRWFHGKKHTPSRHCTHMQFHCLRHHRNNSVRGKVSRISGTLSPIKHSTI